MPFIPILIGFLLILFVLEDAFETVVLPRRVSSRFRFAGLFFRTSWWLWILPVRRLPLTRNRENYLSFFGPLSLLLLLVIWDAGLILGFALLLWGIHPPPAVPAATTAFATDLFSSASTFITVGFGSPSASAPAIRFLQIAEGATGLAFLALVIGYLPLLYQAFAEREVNITMMDARLGSPPNAYEGLLRCARQDHCQDARDFLAQWERWTAQLLETHLSYPVLGFYRSQHDNQSWLAALAAILDTSALLSIGIEGLPQGQARLTFAMARHTVVDLAQVYRRHPKDHTFNRLTETDFEQMRRDLAEAGLALQPGCEAYAQLSELRELYEPYLLSLSESLLMPLPAWLPQDATPDNWQSTPWETPGQLRL